MRATLMYGAGDVRVEHVPDSSIKEPTDAVVQVAHSCICGSDLWPYRSLPRTDHGRRMGHEFIGVVADVGAEVLELRRGDLVVAPFMWADNTCDFCRENLQTSCRHGGNWGHHRDGGQGEAVRCPQAQGTLVRLPVAADSALMPSLLTLSDVLCTGHHAAVSARVGPRTQVTVIGDGAVGLCAVLAARRLGAERIILMGRHPDRTALGRELGATDVVAERGEEGVALVRELTGGDGTHAVLECVGTAESLGMALDAVRDGGAVGRVGGRAVHRGADGLWHHGPQHHTLRRRGPGPGLHQHPHARHHRGRHRPRPGLRRTAAAGGDRHGLRGHGQPRGPQGPRRPLTSLTGRQRPSPGRRRPLILST